MKRPAFAFLSILFATFVVYSQSEPSLLDIHFSGNDRIATKELVDNFNECLGKRWKEPDQRMFEYFGQKCTRSLMFSKGFWRAKVNYVSFRIEDELLTVNIDISEGPRFRLGRLKIIGCEILSKDEIIKLIGQKRGDIADGRSLQDFVYTNLKQKYDELGYPNYSAEFEPKFIESSNPNLDWIVDVTLSIDEGRQFKVGRIVFLGVNEREVEEKLREKFSLKVGEIYSATKLQKAVDALNELQLFEHIDKDVNVDIRTDEEAGNIDLVISLRPPD